MSQRGNQGRRMWQERRGTLAAEITDRITAESTERLRMWVSNGRVPWWIRVKARLRGRPIDLRRAGQAR